MLSGGQDSALCLALAVKKHGADEVAAITFAYGQRHAVETRFARSLAKHFKIAAHKTVKLDFYKELTSNALLNHGLKITSNAKPRASAAPVPPNTVVEGRNAFFLLAASVWAKELGATEVYTGVSEADYSGYPDCRSRFIKAQEKATRLALEYPIKFVTPFQRRTKAEEWALADKLGLLDYIRKHTVTCYNGIPGDGCGKCPACKLRNRGLKEYYARIA